MLRFEEWRSKPSKAFVLPTALRVIAKSHLALLAVNDLHGPAASDAFIAGSNLTIP
jgi:hypothetical protein